MLDEMRELVRYATLAPNGHNAQAWKFAVRDGVIEIQPDHTRGLPQVDPDDRELWISLGCALENLLVAARARGYATEVVYPGGCETITVRLAAAEPQGGPLFDAIPVRQSTRSNYDERPIAAADLDRIRAVPLEPGVSLHLFTDPPSLRKVRDLLTRANLVQYADRDFVAELIRWLRFNDKEALGMRDGLSTRATGNPQLPRWLGRLIVSATPPRQWAAGDDRKMRTTPGVFVLASSTDEKDAWVRTGRSYERLALTMTSLGIKTAFLNQPIEVAEVRERLQAALGLGGGIPQLLGRIGHAEPMPRSVRRPVEDVLV